MLRPPALRDGPPAVKRGQSQNRVARNDEDDPCASERSEIHEKGRVKYDSRSHGGRE